MHHIFGHRSPDTDAIASAIALQTYLQGLGLSARAYQLGKCNLESKFVLDSLGLEPLPILPPNDPYQVLQSGDKICLTDHNESTQSIKDLANFDIRYVIDHHKISLSTPTPAYVRIYPVGCTCTILYQMFAEKSLTISPKLAHLMLSAIISDTLNLTSPTTTDDDKNVMDKLMHIANLSSVQKDDFADAMFAAKSNLSQLSADEILMMDYKSYHIGGQSWGIAGIETTDVQSILARHDDLAHAAMTLKHAQRLDHLMIAIVDIHAKVGYAIAYDDAQNAIITQAFGAMASNGVFVLDGVVSRKQQIVPALEQYYA